MCPDREGVTNFSRGVLAGDGTTRGNLAGLTVSSDYGSPFWSQGHSALYQAAEAFDRLESGDHFGRVVIRLGGSGFRAYQATSLLVSQVQQWMGHAPSDTTAIYLAVRDYEEQELIRRTRDEA